MRRYRISEQSREDLRDIHGYIARDDPEAADRFVDLFFDKFEILAETPHIGTLVEQISPGLRAFSFRRYVIFFRASDTEVEIVRVMQGSQDYWSQF